MPKRYSVRPEMLHWACERAQVDFYELAEKIPDLAAWERGEKKPTLKQLEHFAKKTYTHVSFLFMSEPPDEEEPIPDFRTIADKSMARPSINLLHTIYLCEQRQGWYNDYVRAEGEDALQFVGSASITDDVARVAANIRETLGFEIAERRNLSSWTEALRQFINKAEEIGVLVMVNGVVNNNTHRKLNPEEFRGFAMVDEFAPLVFINGADTKAAQMFTLAHELAHVWLGETGLSNSQARVIPEQEMERWCNQVAAEILVPLAEISREYALGAHTTDEKLRKELRRLAREYKVSTLVVLRRIFDAGMIAKKQYSRVYDAELETFRSAGPSRSGGGNFYATLKARTSEHFARALILSTLEGDESFKRAFYLLGVKNVTTLRQFGRELGLGV